MDTKEVLSPFQFHANNIIDVQIKNNLLARKKDSKISRVFDLDYEITDITVLKDKHFANIQMYFAILIKDLDNNENLLDFRVTIEGIFSAPININKDTFIDLLELNGLTALYSVSRGQIAALSSAVTGFERINLPMINIEKLVEKKHKNTDDKTASK